MSPLKKILIFVLLLCLILHPAMAQGAFADMTVKARAAIVADVNTGVILFEQNADSRQYPASLTKLVTALVAIEHTQMTDKVTASAAALAGLNPYGSSAAIKPGEIFSVEELFYCLLIASGNDAANVFAYHVAGSEAAFVAMMNEKAAALGCMGTKFKNAHGLHDDGHYTTARDMYLITREYIAHADLMKISNTTTHVIPPTNKTASQRILNTTNHLISGVSMIKYLYSPARGIKTGTTTPAGYCLISSAEKDGLYLVSVVLGAAKNEDTGDIMSFVETKRLFEYGFSSFSYKALVERGDPITEVYVDMSQEADNVTAAAQDTITHLLGNDFDKSKVIITPRLDAERVNAPVIKGQILGDADVSYNGKSYGRVNLVALTGVERSSFVYTMERIKAFVQTTEFILIAAALAAAIVAYTVIMVMVNRKKRLRMIKKKGRYL